TLPSGLTLSAANFVVSGPANRLPTISSGVTASVKENSPTSTIVYQTLAQDADGDRIVFSLSGTDAARFTIDQSGAVRFVASPDYETRSGYSFTVTAADSSGAGGSKTVSLAVTDVSEGIRIVSETSAANDLPGSAQTLSRDLFSISSDPNLADSSLPSLRIDGSLSATTDKDFFAVSLKKGELLVLDVDGTPTLDSYVRVIGPDGREVAANDDLVSFDPGSTAHPGVSHNQDSFLRFRAPSDGIFKFSIEAFSDASGPTTSGDYQINVSIGPPATQAQIDEENAAALLSGDQWSSLSLTFGFPTSPSDYGPGEGVAEIDAGMEVLNLKQQAAVRIILGQTAKFTNLTFTEGSPALAQMRYALSDEPATAHAYYPGTGDGGDSWYNTLEYTNPVVGNYEWATFIHETGHALGLKHAQEAPAVAPDRDSLEFSVMTYRSYIGAPVGEEGGGYTNETWGFPQTFMMYDIAALQMMYGANFAHNSGNTVYSWSPTTGAFSINGAIQWTPGANRIFMTIWDGGGNDTYDMSAYVGGTTIDLRPGEWTTTTLIQLASLGDGNRARGNIANALLFNGDARSLIENAVGGSGADKIIANAAANRLTGGPGYDTFIWKAAADSPAAMADVITDFEDSTDTIDLSAIDAIPATPGDDAFKAIADNAFSGTAGELRSVVQNGSLRITGDLDGDASADFQIVLENVTSISTIDIMF
nr:M10 family metallopeptidase C-terminal domain-containing protein [Pseudomonadota bacterium]